MNTSARTIPRSETAMKLASGRWPSECLVEYNLGMVISTTDARQDACGNIATDSEFSAVAQSGCRRTPAKRLSDPDAVFPGREEILRQADTQRMGGQGLDCIRELGRG